MHVGAERQRAGTGRRKWPGTTHEAKWDRVVRTSAFLRGPRRLTKPCRPPSGEEIGKEGGEAGSLHPE